MECHYRRGSDWTGLDLLNTWKDVTTNNYDSFTKLHTPKIILITGHIKSP
jgi:hypothetical protein